MAEAIDVPVDTNVHEDQHKPSDKETHTSRPRSRTWLENAHFFVTGCLFVGCIGAIVFNFTVQKRLPGNILEENPVTRFPGHFMTEQEKNTKLRGFGDNDVPYFPVTNKSTIKSEIDFGNWTWPLLQNYSSEELDTVSQPSYCELDNSNKYPRTKLTYHVCCISYSNLISPSHLPSAYNDNQKLTIAQNVGQNGTYRQYFETQKCCQQSDCSECKCSQTYYVITAVVKDTSSPGEYRVAFVRVPGCCKCLNHDPRNIM